MKRIFFIALAMFISGIGLKSNLFAQEKNPVSSLLPLYLSVKDALINADISVANKKASELAIAIDSADQTSLSESQKKAYGALKEKLSYNARHISESNDIGHQREHFAGLSNEFWMLAKAIKLSDKPVYKQYCPMKKSAWLSAESAIRNPYYGKQMLTCGKVEATL